MQETGPQPTAQVDTSEQRLKQVTREFRAQLDKFKADEQKLAEQQQLLEAQKVAWQQHVAIKQAEQQERRQQLEQQKQRIKAAKEKLQTEAKKIKQDPNQNQDNIDAVNKELQHLKLETGILTNYLAQANVNQELIDFRAALAEFIHQRQAFEADRIAYHNQLKNKP